MPAPKRRRTSGSSATIKSQSTLSFQTTKSGFRTPSEKSKALKSADEKPSKADVHVVDLDITLTPEEEDEDESLNVPAIDIEDPAAKVLVSAQDETGDDIPEQEEEDEEVASLRAKALALSEAKIRDYWTGKERERLTKRVHQEGLGIRERILREFDMCSRYGPSIGIQRMSRWNRAHMLGMDPPLEVLAVLLKEQQAKGKGASELSIMDELIMSSRVSAVEP